MFKRICVVALTSALALADVEVRAEVPQIARAPAEVPSAPQKPEDGMSAEKKAAIAAAIVAGSIALYFALGRPCACPYHKARNGSSCGGRSAWSRPRGIKPLCYPTDITAAMIAAYVATKAMVVYQFEI
ncbi:MAG: hypothetical protein JNM89_15775 [Hyphomicrobiaceae bacterium]|nr:hypothetical protein [Hyphomicrobiaceae bacterium]